MAKLWNYRTSQHEELPTLTTKDGKPTAYPAECYDFIPLDTITQNLYRAFRLSFLDPLDAMTRVLQAVASRPLAIEGMMETAGDYSVYKFRSLGVSESGDMPSGEWLSIPTRPGTTAGVACPHCAGFAPVEGDAVSIVYLTEAAQGGVLLHKSALDDVNLAAGDTLRTTFVLTATAPDQVGPAQEGDDADRTGGVHPTA